jgi:hypothetical protein
MENSLNLDKRIFLVVVVAAVLYPFSAFPMVLTDKAIIDVQMRMDSSDSVKEFIGYLSKDFVFGMAGCKDGEFKAHITTRLKFLRNSRPLSAAVMFSGYCIKKYLSRHQ